MNKTEYTGVSYYVKWNGHRQPNSTFGSIKECENYIKSVSTFGKNGFSIHCTQKKDPIKVY